MKKPQIDIFQTGIQEHINKVGFKNKFLRLWGHDGTVMNERHYYYPEIAEEDVKLFKLLGIYKDLKDTQGKMKGINNAWIELNPRKFDVETLSDELLVQKLDFQIPDGVYTVNITPKAKFIKRHYFHPDPVVHQFEDSLGLLNYSNKTTLGQYIDSNYQQVLDKYLVEGGEESDIQNLIAMHMLNGSNAFTYSIKSVSYSFTDNIKKILFSRSGESESQRYVSYRYSTKSISIELEIKQTGTPTSSDPLVVSILDQRAKLKAKEKAKRQLEIDSARANSDSINNILKEEPVTNDFWLDSRMRTSIFSAKVLKTKDLIPLIRGSLETGYEKKRAKWYKKIIVIAVFVVAFVLSGGTAAATLPAFAASFTIATLAVVALSAAMSSWGDEVGAGFAGRFSGQLNQIGIFIGISAIVGSVATQIASAMTEVTKQAALEGVKYGVTETFAKAVSNLVSDYAKTFVSKLTLEKGITYANQIFGMYSKNRLKSLSNELKTLQQQNAENSQFEEENRSRDISKALIKSHGEMLHQDSVDKYDYQYESWSSPMHVGNIQRTSWKWERTGAKIGLRNNQVK